MDTVRKIKCVHIAVLFTSCALFGNVSLRAQCAVEVSNIINVTCNGESDGAATFTASSSVGPYLFSWSGPTMGSNTVMNNTFTVNDLAAGNYSVSVTDDNGCEATAAFTINQPATLSILTTVASNFNCVAPNTGSIFTTTTGGNVGSLTYQWSNGSTNSSLSGLSGGTYNVTVTDSKGCTDDLDQEVLVTSAIAVTQQLKNVSCFGGSDGEINLSTSISGGASVQFTYLWNTGETTEDLSLIPAGNYAVTVTSSQNCTSAKSYMIAQPTALSISSAIIPSTCGLSNGSINISVSGGTPFPNAPFYQYLWSNNATTEDISNLAGGLYGVTVTDKNGCTGTASFNIVVASTNVVVTVNSVTPVACFGQNTGAIDINATGGSGLNYIYDWDHIPGNSNVQDPSMLAFGLYHVTVSSGGCTGSLTNIQVDQNPAIQLSIATIGGSCGNSSGSSATANPSGGAGGFSYLWSNGATTATITNLPPATYTVTVTDLAGCTKTASATLSVGFPLQIQLQSAAPVCHNGLGSILVSVVSGASAPYQIAWTNGLAQDINIPPSYPISNLTPGNYTVTVTGANGCSDVKAVTVANPPLLQVSPAVTHPSCVVGNNSNGQISLTVLGASPFTFDWQHLPGTNNIQNLTGLQAGPYSVTTTDNNGCTLVSNINLNAPLPLTAFLALSGDGGICEGSAETAALLVTIQNGIGNYSIEFNQTNLNQISFTSSLLIPVAPVLPGVYNYQLTKVTDGNGCIAIGSSLGGNATVTVNQSLPVSVTIGSNLQQGNAICKNSTANFVATAVNGGANPQYQWFRIRNGIEEQLTNQTPLNSYSTSELLSGDIIKCVLQSSIECPQNTNLASNQVTVTVYDLPQVQSFQVANPNYCEGETIMLTASAKNLGTPNFIFQFYGPGGWSLSPSGQFSPLQPVTVNRENALSSMSGVYRVEIVDANTCKSEQAQTNVLVRARPVKPLSGGDKEVCFAPFPNSTYPTLTVSGQNNVDFRWSNSQNGNYLEEPQGPFPAGNLLTPGQYMEFTNNNTPGQYSFWSKTMREGCLSNEATEVKIRILELPVVPIPEQSTYNVCQSAPAPQLKVTTSPSNLAAVWYNANGTVLLSGPKAYTPVSDGTYLIRSLDQFGCQSGQTASILFERWQNPTALFQLDDQNAPGVLAGLPEKFEDLSIKGSNSEEIVFWKWDLGTPQVEPAQVIQIYNPDSSVIEVKYLDPGTYNLCLSVTDGNMCSATKCEPITVDNPNDCRIQFNNNPSVCVNAPFSINVTAIGSGSNLIQSWEWLKPASAQLIAGTLIGTTNTVLSPTFAVGAPGTYSFKLIIRDANLPACIDTGTVIIVVKDLPRVQQALYPAETCRNTRDTIQLELTGTAPFYLKYLVNGNSYEQNNYTENTFNVIYTAEEGQLVDFSMIQIKDEGGVGCLNSNPTTIINIPILPLPELEVESDSCNFNQNQYSITIRPTGGTAPYWINGQPVDSLFTTPTLPNGFFNIINLVDGKGCRFDTSLVKFCNCQDELVVSQVSNVIREQFITDPFVNVCQDQPVQFKIARGSSPGDPGYKMRYYLYRDNIENYLSYVEEPPTGDQLSFPYPGGNVQFDTEYYIQGIRSKIKADGKPDLEGCYLLSEDRTVRYFRKSPTATISTQKVCAGSQTVLNVLFNGNSEYDFSYLIQGSGVSFPSITNYTASNYTSPPFTVQDSAQAVRWPIQLYISADIFGCSALAPVVDTLTIVPRPSIALIAEEEFCKGEEVSVYVDGDPSWKYYWSNPALEDRQNISFTAVSSQSYTVTVTDFTQFPNCSSLGVLNVVVKDVPSPKLKTDIESYCQNVYNPTYTVVNTGTQLPASGYKWRLFTANTGAEQPVQMFNAKDRFGNDPNYIQEDTVFIDWANINPGFYKLYLTQTVRISSFSEKECSGTDSLEIEIQDREAPSPPSGIQYFQFPAPTLRAATGNLCYQWGYTRLVDSPNNRLDDNLASGGLEGQFREYSLPNDYNQTNQKYWLDTWVKNDNGTCEAYNMVKDFCVTRSYLEDPSFTTDQHDLAKETTSVLIFPNPSDGRFTLLFNDCPFGPANLRIFGANGSLVSDLPIDLSMVEQVLSLELGRAPSGLYHLQLLFSNGLTLRKNLVIHSAN